MANGLELKVRDQAREIHEDDPLMELTRIMGIARSSPEAASADPQIAAEDSFSLDLERELAFDEIPADSAALDAEFDAVFEDELTGAIRFEADAPSVVPSLEDELSAMLSDQPDLQKPSVIDAAWHAEADLEMETEVSASVIGDEPDMNGLTALDQRNEASAAVAVPVFEWPVVSNADDALEDDEADSDSALGSMDYDPAERSNAEVRLSEPEGLDDTQMRLEPVEASISFSDDQELVDAQGIELDGEVAGELEEAVPSIDFGPEEIETSEVESVQEPDFPLAPEFDEWLKSQENPEVEAQTGDSDDGLGRLVAVTAPEPVVEAAELSHDEVAQTDDFDIPDFEFSPTLEAEADAPPALDEFEEDYAGYEPPVTATPQRTALADESDFDFDTLLGQELADEGSAASPVIGAAAGIAAGAAAMRARQTQHVDADLDFDPFLQPGIPEDNFAQIAEPAPRRNWIVPAALAGVLLIGGGLYYAFSGIGSSVPAGGPALVKADPEPVKIAPENPGGQAVLNQDKAVYDKVEGDAATLPSQGTLVSESEEPVDIASVAPPVADEPAAKSEARVDPAVNADNAAPAAETSAVTPKKVRTVIVKPDGTLVERPADAPIAADAAPAAAVATPAPAPEPALAPVPVVDTPAPVATQQTPVAEDPIAKIAAVEPEAPKAEAAKAEAPAEPVVTEINPATTAAAAEPVIKVVKTKKIKAPAAAKVEAAAPADAVPVIESRPSDQPVTIVGKTGGQQAAAETQVASADAAPAPTAGGYSIQIASTPSPEAAKSTYAALSRKFGSVIGGKGVSIQKAAVEGKGTVYRVRIPAGSKQNAAAMCAKYKSAGGSCFVTK
ncbi:MAG: SPOR domain-containing protein [Rhizobiaceae bacterium]